MSRAVFLSGAMLAGLLLAFSPSCATPRPAAPTEGKPSASAPGPDASADERARWYESRAAAATAEAKAARADADAAELRTWRTWTLWIGMIGVAGAVAAGGILSWLVSPKIGIPVAAIVAATALSVVAFGATIRWLPLALGIVAVLAGIVWLIYHVRDRAGLRRLWDLTQEEALAIPAVAAAIKRSGVRP